MESTINVAEALNRAPLGKFQAWTFLLCFLVEMLDGFDVNTMGFITPPIAADWRLHPSALGPVLSAGFLGMFVGAVFLAGLADRWGRKPVLVAAAVLFGSMELASTWVGSLHQLWGLRFAGGIGLGGALPNLVTMAAEFVPRRWRATSVAVMYSGIPVGTVLSGFLCAWLLARHGWRSVFFTGGALSLATAAALALWLPESLTFLATRRAPAEKIAALLRRLAPDDDFPASASYVAGEPRLPGLPVKHLFLEGRAAVTVLLWLGMILNLFAMHGLHAWTATLLRDAGLPLPRAIVISGFMTGSTIIVAVAVGWLMDRFRPYAVLVAGFLIAAASLAVAGGVVRQVALLIPAMFLGTMTIGGVVNGMAALAAHLYPTAVRSTGIGWALGMARAGSTLGPLVGGWLLPVSLGGFHAIYLGYGAAALLASIVVLATSFCGAKAEAALAEPLAAERALVRPA